jgi:hypothetical protein
MLEASPPFHVFEAGSTGVDHAFAIARNHAQFLTPLHSWGRSAVCLAVEPYGSSGETRTL